MPTGNDELSRKFIKATKFTLTLDANGRPAVQHSYPSGATVSEEQQVVQVTNLLTSLVAGLFQTWPTKGLQGPVPAFDSQIEDVNSTDRGYTLHLRLPGGPVQLFLDKGYTVTEVVSNEGKLHEHPLYGPSPDGLVFVGNDATDDSQPGGRVEVKYELGTTVLDGLRVPSSAHLIVNQNIDVRFSLDGCTVKKALVVHVITASCAPSAATLPPSMFRARAAVAARAPYPTAATRREEDTMWTQAVCPTPSCVSSISNQYFVKSRYDTVGGGDKEGRR
jgi:hypothetical protein